jgi:putative ABC transport system ATP-binding protein
MIKLKNGVKTYKMGSSNIKALNNISLQINEGEFVSLVGPSGSGKSTFMNVVGALDSLDKGNIWVDGEDISQYNEKQQADYRRKKIGFVFQTFNLQKQLRAGENVEMPLIFGGMKRVQRQELAKKALDQVGLGDRIDHKPNELSGGEQQRVSIARAIVNDPEILLVDEPTGNLDTETGKTVMALLSNLNEKRDVTIVMVTHNLSHAKYAERVFSMRDGEIVNVSKNNHENN